MTNHCRAFKAERGSDPINKCSMIQTPLKLHIDATRLKLKRLNSAKSKKNHHCMAILQIFIILHVNIPLIILNTVALILSIVNRNRNRNRNLKTSKAQTY